MKNLFKIDYQKFLLFFFAIVLYKFRLEIFVGLKALKLEYFYSLKGFDISKGIVLYTNHHNVSYKIELSLVLMIY